VLELLEKAFGPTPAKRASMGGLLPLVERLAKQALLQERLAKFYQHHNSKKVNPEP